MIKIIYKFLLYLFLILNFNHYEIKSDIYNQNYFFDLCISKINLNEKVYRYNDKNNNVDKGIYLVKDYDFNSLSGSLILASHSGNSSISHFKNLDLLKKEDIIKVVYNSNIYYYKVIDIYKIEKTGKFKYVNEDQVIYLITCDKKNNKQQDVIKGNLIKITKKSTFF